MSDFNLSDLETIIPTKSAPVQKVTFHFQDGTSISRGKIDSNPETFFEAVRAEGMKYDLEGRIVSSFTVIFTFPDNGNLGA